MDEIVEKYKYESCRVCQTPRPWSRGECRGEVSLAPFLSVEPLGREEEVRRLVVDWRTC